MWAECSHCPLANRNAAANGRDTKVFEPLCWGPLCYYGDALLSVHFALLGTHHPIQESLVSSGTNKKPWKCLKMLICHNLVWHSFQQWDPCKNTLKVKENTRDTYWTTGPVSCITTAAKVQQVPAKEKKLLYWSHKSHTEQHMVKCGHNFLP